MLSQSKLNTYSINDLKNLAKEIKSEDPTFTFTSRTSNTNLKKRIYEWYGYNIPKKVNRLANQNNLVMKQIVKHLPSTAALKMTKKKYLKMNFVSQSFKKGYEFAQKNYNKIMYMLVKNEIRQIPKENVKQLDMKTKRILNIGVFLPSLKMPRGMSLKNYDNYVKQARRKIAEIKNNNLGRIFLLLSAKEVSFTLATQEGKDFRYGFYDAMIKHKWYKKYDYFLGRYLGKQFNDMLDSIKKQLNHMSNNGESGDNNNRIPLEMLFMHNGHYNSIHNVFFNFFGNTSTYYNIRNEINTRMPRNRFLNEVNRWGGVIKKTNKLKADFKKGFSEEFNPNKYRSS